MESFKEIIGYLGVVIITVLLIVYGMNGGGEAWITTAVTFFGTVFGFSIGMFTGNKVSKAKIEIACLQAEINKLNQTKVT